MNAGVADGGDGTLTFFTKPLIMLVRSNYERSGFSCRLTSTSNLGAKVVWLRQLGEPRGLDSRWLQLPWLTDFWPVDRPRPLIEKIQNHYTIVPAPLRIEPNTAKVLTTTLRSSTAHMMKNVPRHGNQNFLMSMSDKIISDLMNGESFATIL